MNLSNTELDDLIAKVIQGTATEHDVARLHTEMQANQKAMDAYIWQVEIHSRLALDLKVDLPTAPLSHGAKKVSSLIYLPDSIPVKAIRIVDGTMIFGRSQECDVYLNDLSASRKHAKIEASKGKVIIHDLNSRNGTFVDNERVTSSILKPDQEVRFGSVRFRTSSQGLDLALEDLAVFAAPQRAQKHLPQVQLTATRVVVLGHLLRDMSEKEIAEKMRVPQATIHKYVKAVYQAYGVHSKAELLATIIKTGLPHDSWGSPD